MTLLVHSFMAAILPARETGKSFYYPSSEEWNSHTFIRNQFAVYNSNKYTVNTCPPTG